MEADKAVIMEEIKGVCEEARANGFDIKTIKQIIKIRKMDEDKRQQQEELLELYLSTLDME